MRSWSWLFSFGVGVGCTLDGYTCIEDADCVHDRHVGVCQLQGACSFPDTSCPSGQRFGDAGPTDVAGVCVPPTLAKGAGGGEDPDADADAPTDDDAGGGGGGPHAGGNTGGTDDPPPADDDPNLPPAEDLVLHVPMHTGVDGPLEDASGSGFQISCDGACPIATPHGASFGAGRGLRVPHDSRLDTTAAFTLMVWVKPATDGSVVGAQTLVHRPATFAMYLRDYYGDGDNDFCAGFSTVAPWCEEDVVDAAAWYHLALRWDGTFLEQYVDGEMVYRDTPPPGAFSPADLLIGKGATAGLDAFDGTLGDLRLYDIALDDAAIAAVIDAA